MSNRVPPRPSRVAGFRTKLQIAMMLLAAGITGTGLYFAERNLGANVQDGLEREFQDKLTALQSAQELRHVALDERCRALTRRPRFYAALEDRPDTDLLYPNAEAELRDILLPEADRPGDRTRYALHAEFYRFLSRTGAVIPAANQRDIGVLAPEEERQLALPRAPDRRQIGYLWRQREGEPGAIFEIIGSPIFSTTETGEVTAVLVLGFKPLELQPAARDAGIKSGLWLEGRLNVHGLSPAAGQALGRELGELIRADPAGNRRRVEVDGVPHLLFAKQLNPGALYPPAYEVALYPLTDFLTRQRKLRWQFLGTGVLILFVGLLASHYLAGRLSDPVEKLAVDSAEDRAERERVEAALELTSEELQRSARFSADASHQLKTPVTVLRAGLEELLAREKLTPAECQEISALIHQTYRLSSLIEDLLLLSRMDAGRLKLNLGEVDLSQLIEAALDDLGALPDELELKVETDCPPGLRIAGEKRYTEMILHNLFENARKYNERGGRIRVTARAGSDGLITLTVGNSGRGIAPAAQARIFERFHRGAIGENVPGYGLGLNLARELARLHGGDLRLARSAEGWTEFEVTFRRADASNLANRSA